MSHDLKFGGWDETIANAVDDAGPLNPAHAEACGTPKTNTGMSMFWSLSIQKDGKFHLLLPVKVRGAGGDAELVEQAASSARHLVNAAPFRLFEVPFAYNHRKDEFRVFIFHRGGLTASLRMKLSPVLPDNHGYDGLVRILMSILTWTHARDIGFPLFTNSAQFILPFAYRPLPTRVG